MAKRRRRFSKLDPNRESRRSERQQANRDALKVTLDDDDRKAITMLPKNQRLGQPAAFAPDWD